MSISIKPVAQRRQLRIFIYLPAVIHRNHPLWVPPIYYDEWQYFSPNKNRSFYYSDTTLALAYVNGTVAGRIMGIINHRYNEQRKQKSARFAYFECWNDSEVARALLGYVENWARNRGMNKLVGPLGFNDQDPEGYLVEGFEFEPTLATYYNFEYIIPILESNGYSKDMDYVVHRVPLEIPDVHKRIYNRISTQKKYALLEFRKRKDLRPYILPVLSLMNETFLDLYNYSPLDNEDMVILAKKYMPIIDPRFVKVVQREEQVVAFIIGIPNLSEGIRKSKGRLFPIGLFHIFRAARNSRQLDIMVGAIKPEDRGKGLDVLLGIAIINSGKEAGFEYADSHHQLETNTKIRAEMEKLGGQVYKRFRVFQKQL